MNTQSLLAFAFVAGLAALTPGPAILLALRNGATFGTRSVIWSALGNICGLFCLSTAAILGLGVLLKSSALLFGAVKLIGALYLFYVGVRHLFGRATLLADTSKDNRGTTMPGRRALYREAILTAATNPKGVMFFTALFPQFLDAQVPLAPQFFILTGIFMCISYTAHMSYALLASRAKGFLLKPALAKWMNRVVGTVFISFGALLLALRRQAV